MHLLPNGTVFYSGWSTQSRTFNPATNTWSGVIATTNYGGSRTYGSSVLLPLTPANGYKPRVMIFGGGNPSTATTEIIDLSAATPAWVFGPSMSQPRIEMDATLLPNGKVLAVGGSLNDEDTGTASLQADLYDSVTNTMGSAGSNAVPRLYHSVSLLLPDATVWIAGGNPQRGSFEPSVEIYTPPYLFKPDGTPATRPTLTSVSPTVIGYGTAFQVTTPDAANIASVVLMKNGAVTHAFDMDQRMVGLTFSAGSGVLNVTGPPNGNTAPPGYYMLFLINTAGAPSVAQFVRVSTAPTDLPPTGTITSPASDTSIAPGQSVTFAGSGSAPSGAITAYSWSIRGGTPPTSTLQNPGAVTFSNAGTYTAILTVTDTAGITDPNPPTRTITVAASGTAPDVTSVTPNVGAQGQTNLSVTIAGSNFMTGPTCDFGAGVEVNSCTFNSATLITANLNILAGAAVGPRNVTVTNTDNQSSTLTAGFSVTAGVALPPPVLTGISPNSEFQGASNVTVILTGTDFQPSPTCTFDTDFGGTINTCTWNSATQITVNLTIAANATLGGHNVSVKNPDGQTTTLINGFTVTENLGNTVKLGSGFTVGALVLNGNAQLNGSMLELTDGNLNEDSSAWFATRVNVQNFATDFTFHVTPGVTADGFTFALQSNSTAALGVFGGGLGYGPVDAGDPGGIPNSIAVKFDLYDNNGEGINSTGLFINGAAPNIPAVDLTPSGIDLHSGDIFAAHLTYDGTNLVLTLTDTVTNAVFTNSWPIDIPTTVGAPTAYAGFTGGTGGIGVTTDILTWTLGPLAPAVGFSPVGPVDFPDTTVNTTSAPIAITITNSGSATLHISAVALTGTNLSDFAAATDTCTGAALAPNATCAVGVTFKPSGTGPHQANLEITDDASGSPQSLALTGNGLAAATPGVTFTPATLVTFPNTTINTTSAATTITITNSGNATLNITTATLAGANAADFAAASNTCNGASLAANATCTVGVTFTPSAVGLRQATLQVADNAPASPQSLTLNGTGTSVNASSVTITPASLSFTTTQGATSAPMTLTVTNSGTAPLHITGVTFVGPDVAEFVNPASSCTAAIAPSASCTIAVSFAPVSPMSASHKTETVVIAGDATNLPQSVTVTGTISASAFTVTNASSLTATVTAGQTAQYNVQLMPGPGFSGSVTMACSGAPAGAVCTVANPIMLTSGTPTTFAVSVTTTARSLTGRVERVRH